MDPQNIFSPITESKGNALSNALIYYSGKQKNELDPDGNQVRADIVNRAETLARNVLKSLKLIEENNEVQVVKNIYVDLYNQTFINYIKSYAIVSNSYGSEIESVKDYIYAYYLVKELQPYYARKYENR